jgi:hypothetical protein
VTNALPAQVVSDFESEYRQFLAGDPDASVFASDAVLHVQGRSRVAGSFSGEDQIRAYLRQLHELSGGTVRIELEGVSNSGPYLVAWQRLTASRDGKTLEDQQCLRVLMKKGRAQEAWLYPSDLRAHDEFWGGSRRPLFTPEDRETLADAFRQARPQPPGTAGIIALVLAMIGASVAIFAFNTLNQWRRPVTAVVSTQSVTTLRHMTMSGVEGTVRWILHSAYVGELAVSGAEDGAVEVLLPLDQSECQGLATALDGTCTEGEVAVATPVDLRWSIPQPLSSNGAWLEGRTLDLAPLGGPEEEVGVALFSQTSSRPSLCFNSPLNATTLTASRGTAQQQLTFSFEGDEPTVTCEAALRLVVGSEGDQPPTFELGAVEMLTLQAEGPTSSLEGLTGEVALTPGGTTALGSPTVLTLQAAASEPLEASLELGAGLQSLKVRSSAATSALTETGELVPSEWQRSPGILVPLLGGFVGAFVVTPLGVAVQGLMAALKRWETRFVDAWRRRREPHAR